MQIEEAIEKLKETAKQCRNSKECWENEDCCDCYVEVEDIFAIDTVLNELEKKDKIIDEIIKEFYQKVHISTRCYLQTSTEECMKYKNCYECIKQYFIEKASE